MAKSIEISYDEIVSYIPKEGSELKIGVAVSGGRDSVALLHYLKTLAEQGRDKEPKLKIYAINVEHGIRAEDSVKDSEFVKRLCDGWNIKLFAYSVNALEFAKQNGYTLEQAARILRYGIFDTLLKDGSCDAIALAHHLDDQVETVFMRILRGTGIRGLAGMKKVNGKYIRPFLDYDRESIDSYISANGLQYVEDATNGDLSYTRNFLRVELARIKERFPAMSEAIVRLTSNAEEADSFIDLLIPEPELKDGEAYIKTSDCVKPVITKRLIFKACAALGVVQDIEDRHLKLLLDLVNAQNGKQLMLTHGIYVHRQDGYLVFTLKTNEARDFEIDFCEGNFDSLGVSIKKIDRQFVEFGAGTLFADLDKIPSGAVIRTRREGDVIRKFGGGSKSLGDFLTDKKIPLRNRDNLRVLAKDNRVLAVFGVDISEDVKIDGDTINVIALSETDK